MGVRQHGFEPPFDNHQVGSWVAFGLFAVCFAVLYAPVHADAGGLVATILYALLVGATILTNVWAVRADPADPGLLAKRKADKLGEPPPPPLEGAVNYCYLCEVQVRKRSKHCRRCNKCVDVFDHHCPWLNTCVGRTNYKYFLALLCATFGLTTVQVATAIAACTRFAANKDAAMAALQGAYGAMAVLAYVLLMVAAGVFVLLAWLLIIQLGTFHIGLMYKGITTYEFIIAQRNRQKARDAKRGPNYTPTWRDHCSGWLDRNAPCLAVCDLCEAPPPAAEASKKKEPPKPGRASSSRASAIKKEEATKEVAKQAAAKEEEPAPKAIPVDTLEIDTREPDDYEPVPPPVTAAVLPPPGAPPPDAPDGGEPEMFDDDEEEDIEPPADADVPAPAPSEAPAASDAVVHERV